MSPSPQPLPFDSNAPRSPQATRGARLPAPRTLRPTLTALLLCSASCADETADDGPGQGDTGPSTMTAATTASDSTSTSLGSGGPPTETADATTDDAATSGTLGTGDGPSTGSSEATNGEPALQPQDDTFFVAQGESLVVGASDGVLANDLPTDRLSVTDFDPSSTVGAIGVDPDGGFSFVPAPEFWGSDTFGYTVESASGDVASATVTVYVSPRHIQLASVAGGFGGFVVEGDPASWTGSAVDCVGDLNGDGMDDVIVGASDAAANGERSGRSTVVFGKATTSAVNAAAPGPSGFVMIGEDEGDLSGFSAQGAGDVNNDGINDVVIGAYDAGPPGLRSGRAYVVFGTANTGAVELGELGTAGFPIHGANDGDRMGTSVDGAGDVNGDGLDDVIVGAWAAAPNGFTSGQSVVVFGKADSETVDTATLGSGGFVLNGEAPSDLSGFSVAGAGDVNGDGLDDLIVGAPRFGESGRAYVIFGKADTSPVELSALGEGGFSLTGGPLGRSSNGEQAGTSVNGVGDINGDGLDDVVVGAPYGTTGGLPTGRCYVVFGKADATPVALSALGDGGFVVTGEFELGRAASSAGDVNGDGLGDLIFGADQFNANGPDSGRAYVLFGSMDPTDVDLSSLGDHGFVLDGADTNDRAGFSVGGAGDINGDGVGDIIVGAIEAEVDGTAAGRAYVVFGTPAQ